MSMPMGQMAGRPDMTPLPPAYPQAPVNHAIDHVGPINYPQASPAMYPQGVSRTDVVKTGSRAWLWWVIGLLALGAAAGAVLALVMNK